MSPGRRGRSDDDERDAVPRAHTRNLCLSSHQRRIETIAWIGRLEMRKRQQSAFPLRIRKDLHHVMGQKRKFPRFTDFSTRITQRDLVQICAQIVWLGTGNLSDPNSKLHHSKSATSSQELGAYVCIHEAQEALASHEFFHPETRAKESAVSGDLCQVSQSAVCSLHKFQAAAGSSVPV